MGRGRCNRATDDQGERYIIQIGYLLKHFYFYTRTLRTQNYVLSPLLSTVSPIFWGKLINTCLLSIESLHRRPSSPTNDLQRSNVGKCKQFIPRILSLCVYSAYLN